LYALLSDGDDEAINKGSPQGHIIPRSSLPLFSGPLILLDIDDDDDDDDDLSLTLPDTDHHNPRLSFTPKLASFSWPMSTTLVFKLPLLHMINQTSQFLQPVVLLNMQTPSDVLKLSLDQREASRLLL
jgi:hypothetical protein